MSQPSTPLPDGAKDAILQYDQATIGKVAAQIGKENWSNMSWAERLQAVEADLPPSKPATPLAPPSAASRGPALSNAPSVHPATPQVVGTPALGTPRAATPASLPRSESKISRASAHSHHSRPPATPPTARLPSAPCTPVAAQPQPVSPAISKKPSFTNAHPPSRTASMVSRVSAPYTPVSERPPPSPAQPGISPIQSVHSPAQLHSPAHVQSPVQMHSPAQLQSPTQVVQAPCNRCSEHLQRIAQLEAELHEAKGAVTVWKAKAQKKQKSPTAFSGQAQALAPAANTAELEALGEQNAVLAAQLRGSEAELVALAQELEACKAELDARDAEVAQLQGGDCAEELELMKAQVWTMEKALLLRNEEIVKTKELMKDFVTRIAELDEQLAMALTQLIQQTEDEVQEQEKQMFNGATADEAVGEVKKKTLKKRRLSSRRGSKVPDVEVMQLRHDNEMLKHRLQTMAAEGSADVHHLKEKDVVIKGLQEQLQKAQEAIISGVEQGVQMRKENEVKLRETKTILKKLMAKNEAEAKPAETEPTANPSAASPQYQEDLINSPQDVPVWTTPLDPLPSQRCAVIESTSRPAMTRTPPAFRGVSPPRPPPRMM